MSKLLNRFFIITVTVAAMAALQGCHSTRQAISTTVSHEAETELFARLTSDYRPWSDIYMPVTLSVSSPVDMSISGRATFVRDSEIYLSLRMLGIEVAVVYINNERIYVIDKFHKRYITEELSRLPGDLPLNVSNLQDLLTGRAFLPGHTSLTAADAPGFSLSGVSDDTWTLTPVSQVRGADWHFNASRTTPPVLTGISLRLAAGTPVECVYTGQTNTVAGLLASALALSAPVGDKKLEVGIIWGIDDAKWNTGRTVKFTAPGNSYKKVSIDALIKSFKTN